jgi:hypothetical protein
VRRAGLPDGFFEQEKIYVTTDELFSLWRAVAQTSRDPGIGLKLGVEWRVERYDPGTIAALHSKSFGDALQCLARYKQLVCPEELRIIREKGEAAVEFAFLLAKESEPPVLVDLCLSWILAIGRRGTEAPFTPLRLELTIAMGRPCAESVRLALRR